MWALMSVQSGKPAHRPMAPGGSFGTQDRERLMKGQSKMAVVMASLLVGVASGALAGMVGINEISGVQGKLTLDFVAGAGFTGIAVSLMGRNHPLGVVLAALLFGILQDGGPLDPPGGGDA